MDKMTPNQIRDEAESQAQILSPIHGGYLLEGVEFALERMPQVDDAMVERFKRRFLQCGVTFYMTQGPLKEVRIESAIADALEAAFTTDTERTEGEKDG